MRTLSLRVLQQRKMQSPPVPPYWRPKTRGDCLELPRPCPYVGCRHHLMLDAKSSSLKLYVDEPDMMRATCSLDLADEGPKTLEEIAEILGITKERVRQMEEEAMASITAQADYLEGEL